MMKNLLAATVLGLSMASAASATVVLQDDFNYGSGNTLNIGANFLAPNWTAGPWIDYLSDPSTYGYLCQGTGGCLDLDGSGNSSGLLLSVISFAAGTYELSFELFGNGRGAAADTVTITLGNIVIPIINIASSDDVSTIVPITFTTTGGFLTFKNSGGDNQGAILSSVTLSAVPLPAGGLLLIGALGGLAALRRRKAAAV